MSELRQPRQVLDFLAGTPLRDAEEKDAFSQSQRQKKRERGAMRCARRRWRAAALTRNGSARAPAPSSAQREEGEKGSAPAGALRAEAAAACRRRHTRSRPATAAERSFFTRCYTLVCHLPRPESARRSPSAVLAELLAMVLRAHQPSPAPDSSGFTFRCATPLKDIGH